MWEGEGRERGGDPHQTGKYWNTVSTYEWSASDSSISLLILQCSYQGCKPHGIQSSTKRTAVLPEFLVHQQLTRIPPRAFLYDNPSKLSCFTCWVYLPRQQPSSAHRAVVRPVELCVKQWGALILTREERAQVWCKKVRRFVFKGTPPCLQGGYIKINFL